MSGRRRVAAGPVYQLRLGGELDEGWSAWFDGLAITVVDGNTFLTGRVPDQAALYSLLARIRDLGLPLLGVQRVAGAGGSTAVTGAP